MQHAIRFAKHLPKYPTQIPRSFIFSQQSRYNSYRPNRGTSLYRSEPTQPSQLRRNDGYTHFNRGPDKTSRIFYYVTGGLTLIGGVWYVSHLERAPYTKRLRLMAMTREQEIALGAAAYNQLLSSSVVLHEHHPSTQRVRKIGVRLARQLKRRDPELLRGFKWRFTVLNEGDVPNAACVPGGRVVVFSGLLKLIADDDDMLAAVLAHEIAHAVQRHSAERLSSLRVLYVIQTLVNMVFDFGGFTHLLGHLLVSLPYSRKLELEADFVGLQLMADACYDPRALKRMLDMLADEQLRGDKESRSKNWLSTHPLFKDRITAIDKALVDVHGTYEVKCGVKFDEWRNAVVKFS